MDNSSFCFLWAISVWFHFHHMGHETKHLQIRKKVSYFVLHRRERWRCLSFCGFAFCLFADFVDVIAVFFFFFFFLIVVFSGWYRKDNLKGHGGVAAHYTLQIASVNASFLNTFRREIDAFLRQFGLNSMIPILGLKFDGSLWLKDC